MTGKAKPAKLELTAEQKQIVADIRAEVERDRPEIIAEGHRVAEAAAATSVQLRGAFALLRAVRKSQKMTLDTLADKTGISKPSLSRMENDPAPNVTLTTLHRVATALGYDLHIAVVPTPVVRTSRSGRVTSQSSVRKVRPDQGVRTA